ncbi:MAG TPA: hypothetical protein VLX85_02245 [Stellaceae bacterium]|nr:hypothetical protein [Stellaceae bacterium]
MVARGSSAAWGADEFLGGARLFADVAQYASFGVHRFGSPGDRATTDWIAGELRAAGFSVEFQPVVLGRQYVVERATVLVGADEIAATPFWWPPEDKAAFRLTAPLVRDGEAADKFLRIALPYDREAYLGPAHRAAIREAAARRPAAILLVIGNPAEDRFAYNVTQEDEPWPVPVLVVAAKKKAVLERAITSGTTVTLAVAGRYERSVAGRNVVARLGGGQGSAIVVSTPMTGWYGCVCERGPGIANFLALARTVAAEKTPGHFVFVATAGHEIGHGGMAVFLKHGAPEPQATVAWMHFGSSNACYDWTNEPDAAATKRAIGASGRVLVLGPSSVALADESFDAIDAARFVAEKQAIGELRDVKAAGYRKFFGLVGRHRFFHTPADDLGTTGPEILEPVARAFAQVLRTLAERGGKAFE